MDSGCLLGDVNKENCSKKGRRLVLPHWTKWSNAPNAQLFMRSKGDGKSLPPYDDLHFDPLTIDTTTYSAGLSIRVYSLASMIPDVGM